MTVYTPVVSSAVVIPKEVSPLKSSTILPASAVPIIIGVESLVSDVVVDMNFLLVAIQSKIKDNISELTD